MLFSQAHQLSLFEFRQKWLRPVHQSTVAATALPFSCLNLDQGPTYFHLTTFLLSLIACVPELISWTPSLKLHYFLWGIYIYWVRYTLLFWTEKMFIIRQFELSIAMSMEKARVISIIFIIY